jgi:hypothetical protein
MVRVSSFLHHSDFIIVRVLSALFVVPSYGLLRTTFVAGLFVSRFDKIFYGLFRVRRCCAAFLLAFFRLSRQTRGEDQGERFERAPASS